MKRGGPLQRRTPLQGDPAKNRAWQQRSKPMQRANLNSGPPAVGSSPRRAKPKRNDGPWKAEVHRRYGVVCVSCGATRDVQADHIWPRGQGGPSDPRNGLPLCGDFSDTGENCHGRKTASTMVIRHEWLQQEQIDFLADAGWVRWDEDGQPHGRGWRHFAPIAGAEQEGWST